MLPKFRKILQLFFFCRSLEINKLVEFIKTRLKKLSVPYYTGYAMNDKANRFIITWSKFLANKIVEALFCF